MISAAKQAVTRDLARWYKPPDLDFWQVGVLEIAA